MLSCLSRSKLSSTLSLAFDDFWLYLLFEVERIMEWQGIDIERLLNIVV
jgi:hypothetical protein